MKAIARWTLVVLFLGMVTAAAADAMLEEGVGGARVTLEDLSYAVELVGEGMIDEAVPVLDAIVDRCRHHADASLVELARHALYLKVLALGSTDNHDAIITACDTFIAAVDPGKPDVQPQLASTLLHRALALGEQGETEAELDCYRRIIAMYRQNPCDDLADDAAAAMRNLGISLRDAGYAAAGDALLNEMRVLFADTTAPGALLHLAIAMQNIQQTLISTRDARSVARSAVLADEYGAIIDKHRDADDPASNEALARMMYARSALLYLAWKVDEANALGAELADRFKYEIEGDIRMVVASAMAQRGIILGAKEDKREALAALEEYIDVFTDAWEPEILDQLALVLFTRIRFLVAAGDSAEVVAACDDYLGRHIQGDNPALSAFLESVEATRREALCTK